MVRAFIGIDLPASIREEIAAVQPALRAVPADISLVNPAIIHITLRFIGEVTEEEIGRISAALQTIKVKPFPVSIRPVTLNSRTRPRVIWCGVEDQGRSAALHQAIEAVLSPLGYEPEARAFTPHATVGRIRRGHSSLEGVIDSLGQNGFGDFEVGEFKLKQSVLTAKGPIYTDLCVVTL
ncbi:RNA 2',3'-cyclic phosphodiesterase [Methanosphaerula palustris]|uniref:RNA 2',3'-cyclic phosphodiesterase n=1 Tax=Methanosphaerula palustris (strain ATCC BAA-1556 / DSM 19958 / E1-9c) TaxID=521011 RepID=B8GHT8_METPE|nr:RNA 2',3'-cyclic phosphodiesterase [Methanosphaerula palustris]ACL15408.1 2'-5' RNA ligase [Methanosphaerula palustris E1-9c]